MTKKYRNIWAERFEPLLDPEIIKQKATVKVAPLNGLCSFPMELAAKHLENALETVFHPTSQCVAILARLVGLAHAHCLMTYKNDAAHIGGVYAQEAPLPSFVPPICLTGLAGTGKSELTKAFIRIQDLDRKYQSASQHSLFSLKRPWHVTINAQSDAGAMLSALTGATGKPSQLVTICRRKAFRDGIPFVIADEFQFATGSTTANARITQMLLSLGYIGIPSVFVANFSLLLRLLKRPEEDQQRLLSNSIVLLPDHWTSEDWQLTLRAQKSVAPEILVFDPQKDASELHRYSAGRKRAMKRLIVIAFREQFSRGGTVDLAAIARAYRSEDYAWYRGETEILASQAIRNCPDKMRKDLWCPIPLAEGRATSVLQPAIDERADRVAEAELMGSLTADERKAAKAIEKTIKLPQGKPGKVVSLQKNSKPTSEELKQNANWFKNNL